MLLGKPNLGLVGAAMLSALALAVLIAGVRPAAADCASACRAQHNQCRIQTKGNPSCDAQLTACLRSCSRK